MVHLITLPPELISEICAWLWIVPSSRTHAVRTLFRTHRVFADESRSQLFVYMMLRTEDDLESWIPFLESSPCVLRAYKTIFVDYPVIDHLRFVAAIFALRARATHVPLRLVLHRVVIANFLQAMDLTRCLIFDTVVMYRCVYNKDDLRMLFTCCSNTHTWRFPPWPRSTYSGHCGCPLPPLLNVLKFPPLTSLTLCPEFGPEFSFRSRTWLEDLSQGAANLEYLHIAFKAMDMDIVIDLLRGAHKALTTLHLKIIQGTSRITSACDCR